MEAFGTVQMLPAQIQHAKSDNIGCWSSEPLDIWLVVCYLYDRFDWWCASESARCGKGRLLCVLCFSMHSLQLFPVFMFWNTGTRLAKQNVNATIYLAAVEAVCFHTTFLPNGSGERQWIGRIKAVGCWFESGWCAGSLKAKGHQAWLGALCLVLSMHLICKARPHAKVNYLGACQGELGKRNTVDC